MKSHIKRKISNKDKFTKKKKISGINMLSEYYSFKKTEAVYSLPSIILQDKYAKTEQYVSLIAISGIDIYTYDEYDRERAFDSFASASSALDIEHKYIFTDISPNFAEQKDYLKYKLANTHHEFSAAMLKKRYDELVYLEENHTDRLAYMMLYCKDKRKLDENVNMYLTRMTEVDTSVCSQETILRVLHKMLSLGDKESCDYSGYDEQKVYPDNVRLGQNYIKVNDTYATTVVVNAYPAFLKDLTFASFINQSSDISIILDCKKREKETITREVGKSLDEFEGRLKISQKAANAMDTSTEYHKIIELYDNLSNGNEQVFSVTLRFLITDTDLDNLNKKVKSLMQIFEDDGIKGYVPINQFGKEYFNFFLPSDISKNPFPLYDTYSRQYPFYYQQHIDGMGMYFGRTDTNGLVVLNTFTKTDFRPSYDLLAIGMKGGGKSITLKTMLEDQLLLGNKVLVLDIEGEYITLCDIYDGQIIRMTNRSCINPLQLTQSIIASAENSDGSGHMNEEEAKQSSYQSEISRIITFMHLLLPSFSDDEEMKFSELLTTAYKRRGINNNSDFNSIPSEQYPVFSDILHICEEDYRNAQTQYEKEVCERLRKILQRMCKGGSFEVFDNHTNVDIQNKNLIVFDVSVISELDEKLQDAIMFNILSLMWTEVAKNVHYNKNLTNPFDRKNVVCLIDEAHRFISAKHPQCTNFILKLVRRSRKYFSGLWFATQSILDFIKESGNSAAAEDIKTIFMLVQYKVILKQDGASLNALKESFPQFTMSELRSTTNFSPGEMLLSLNSSKMKIHCTRRATDLNLMYMGTSEDSARIVNKLFNELYIESNDRGLTQEECGRQLLCDKEKYSEFIQNFTSEVVEILDVPYGVNDKIDNIIQVTVLNFAQGIMNKAAAMGRM